MCYVIDSSQLLANVLRTQDKVTVKELKQLAERISQTLSDVAVDISHYSLSAALESYPNKFQRQDDFTITRIERLEEEFVDVYFNQRIPKYIRVDFLGCIEPRDVHQP